MVGVSCRIRINISRALKIHMQSSTNSNILFADELVQKIIPFLDIFIRMQSSTNSDILCTDELVQNIIPFLDILIQMQSSNNSISIRPDELVQNTTYHSWIYHFSSNRTKDLLFVVSFLQTIESTAEHFLFIWERISSPDGASEQRLVKRYTVVNTIFSKGT